MSTNKNIGQILIDKAKELDPTYKPDKFNDMAEATKIILSHMGQGGGGGSVPVLPLDISTQTAGTFTEEQLALIAQDCIIRVSDGTTVVGTFRKAGSMTINDLPSHLYTNITPDFIDSTYLSCAYIFINGEYWVYNTQVTNNVAATSDGDGNLETLTVGLQTYTLPKTGEAPATWTIQPIYIDVEVDYDEEEDEPIYENRRYLKIESGNPEQVAITWDVNRMVQITYLDDTGENEEPSIGIILGTGILYDCGKNCVYVYQWDNEQHLWLCTETIGEDKIILTSIVQPIRFIDIYDEEWYDDDDTASTRAVIEGLADFNKIPPHQVVFLNWSDINGNYKETYGITTGNGWFIDCCQNAEYGFYQSDDDPSTWYCYYEEEDDYYPFDCSGGGNIHPIPYEDNYIHLEDWGAYSSNWSITNLDTHDSGELGYLGFENNQSGVELLHSILDAWHNNADKIIEIDCPACGAICEVEDVQYNQPVNSGTANRDVNIKIRVGYHVEMEDDDYMNWLYHSTYRVREYFSYDEEGPTTHCYIESVITEACTNCKFITEVNLSADELVVGADLSQFIMNNCMSPITIGHEVWDQNHRFVFKDEDFISYIDGYNEYDSTVKKVFVTYRTIDRTGYNFPECYATMTVYYSNSMDEQYKTWMCPAWFWQE